MLDVVVAGCVPRCLRLGVGRRRPAEIEDAVSGDGKGKERQRDPELSDALRFRCGSERYHISSGDAGLDAALGGGIRTGMLTEIVGER